MQANAANAAVAGAMGTATKAMGAMVTAMDPKKVAQQVQQFDRQNAQMGE